MDWNELAARYMDDHQETRISLKQWCKQHQINYQNARKHISVREAKARSSNTPKTKRQKVIAAQPNKANHTSFSEGNQAARKHGAYSCLLDAETVELASRVQGLEDELLVCRSRLISVIKSKAEIEQQWKSCNAHEERVQLSELMLKFVDAEDRTVARIESLTATLSKIERNQVANNKDSAQVKLIQHTIEEKVKATKIDDNVTFNIDW